MAGVDREQAVGGALGVTPKPAVAHRDLMAVAKSRVAKLGKMLKDDGPQQTFAFLRVWQLSKRLRRYRDVLTTAWSDATCYQPSVQGFQSSPVPSFGQCGVSSAWLIPRLNWHQRLRASYCVGHIVFDGGREGRSEFHCWVEIGGPAGRLVIDLTFDQFGYRDRRKVLCAPHRRLLSESIEYQREGRMRFRKLCDDDVWQRYQILLDATGEQRAARRQWTALLTQR